MAAVAANTNYVKNALDTLLSLFSESIGFVLLPGKTTLDTGHREAGS